MKQIKPFTDVGNAERFVSQHKDEIKYCSQQKKWFCWSGECWKADGTGEIFQKAKQTVKNIEAEIDKAEDQQLWNELQEHGNKSQSFSRIKAMIKLAESEPEIIVHCDSFDNDPMLLNCTNGTIDLSTGELLPHSRNHLITKSTQVPYNENAGCPGWLAFLEKIMAGNESMIAYLQKIVGYALTGSMKEQCLFILYGFGANGKSTSLEVMRKMLGDYAMHTPANTLLANNIAIRNDLARLNGSRFVSAVEIGVGKKLDEALTKELTGGDPITSRFLFREFFEQRPTFKLFVAANYKPEIQGTDDGIWRRIRLVPFNVILRDEEMDRDLASKLENELPGILSWAVKGCLEWQKFGLKMPDEVKSATLEYREDSDVISRFIEDRCEQNQEAIVSVKNLYDTYKSWTEECADEFLTKKTFGHFLKQHGYRQRKNNSVRYWIGLEIKKTDCLIDD